MYIQEHSRDRDMPQAGANREPGRAQPVETRLLRLEPRPRGRFRGIRIGSNRGASGCRRSGSGEASAARSSVIEGASTSIGGWIDVQVTREGGPGEWSRHCHDNNHHHHHRRRHRLALQT